MNVALATVLASTAPIHGACPAGGAPQGRTYGTSVWPVGFSPTSRFAAVVQEDSLAGTSWSFRITSLVDDTEIARIDWPDGGGAGQPLSAFLDVSGADITKLAEQHGVVLKSWPEGPTPFPQTVGDQTLTTKLSKVGTITTVTLASSGLGVKQIDRVDAFGVDVLGAWPSPFEPRAAVFFTVASPAAESSLNCRVRIVGAHLEAGFK